MPEAPIPPLTREQVRQIDRIAIDELAFPGIVLMENAAINVAAQVLDITFEHSDIGAQGAAVCIICGSGNNAGDGFAVARHLHNCGMNVSLFAAGNPQRLRGEAATNCRICERMGLPIEPLSEAADIQAAVNQWAHCDILIDAMLGTGFHGELRQPITNIIQQINQIHHPVVVAIDVPSGLDCDTGKPSPQAIRADVTVTFIAPKFGFMNPPAPQYLGELVVVDIGVPPELVARVAADT